MYYLQSRYYNPTTGRFINADSYVSTGQGFVGNNMFAYCLNSPVLFEDTTGTRVCIPEEVEGLSRYGYFIRESSPADSPEEQIAGVINGQGLLKYAAKRFGLGTYGKNGCTFIATYNAMQMLGKPQSLSSIKDEYFLEHGTVLWGACGVSPLSMVMYFASRGIDYTGSASCEQLTAGAVENSIYVFTVFNKVPISDWHCMSALYHDGMYYVLNRHNSVKEVELFPSLQDAYGGGAWIYGIRID